MFENKKFHRCYKMFIIEDEERTIAMLSLEY